MSNRLSNATPRRDLPESLPPHGIATSALNWLLGAGELASLPRTMQRDLGLPEVGPDSLAFEREIIRSRVFA